MIKPRAVIATQAKSTRKVMFAPPSRSCRKDYTNPLQLARAICASSTDRENASIPSIYPLAAT